MSHSWILMLVAAALLTGCEARITPVEVGEAGELRGEEAGQGQGQDQDQEAEAKGRSVEKTEKEWREILSAQEFDVLRKKGTERAFTGEYWNTKTDGTYHCRGCGTALFRSDAKFDSGCGWPSFFEPLEGARLEEVKDTTFGMTRTEIVCKTCGGHLGHVFNDGPKPTGLRYCINSVSIKLDPSEKPSDDKQTKEKDDDSDK